MTGTRGRAYGNQLFLRGFGLLAMAGFFAVVARVLDVGTFSNYVVALAVYSIAVVLADFGLTQTLVVDLSRLDRRADVVVSEGVRALVVSSVLAAMFASAVALVLSVDVALVLALMAPAFFLNQIGLPFMVVRQSRHQFLRVGVAEAAGRVVALALLTLFVVLSFESVGFVVLASTVGVLVQLGLLVLRLPNLRAGGSARGLGRRAAPIGVTNAAAYMHVRVDQVLLAALSTAMVVGSYAVAYRVVDASLGLVSAVAILGLPLLAVPEVERRRATGSDLHRLLLGLASFGAIGTFLLADPLVRVLGGEEYLGATSLLRALTPAIWFAVVNLLGALILIAERRTRPLVLVGLGTVAANVALNLVLIPRAAGEGAAIATGVTEGFGALVIAVMAARALPGVYQASRITVAATATVVGTLGARALWTAGLPFLAGVAVLGSVAAISYSTGLSAAVRALVARSRAAGDSAADTGLAEVSDPVLRDLT